MEKTVSKKKQKSSIENFMRTMKIILAKFVNLIKKKLMGLKNKV